jgi:preprotein translocase subunit SecB
MTDEQSSKELLIQHIVIKDLSFETPMGRKVYSLDWQPVYSWTLDLSNDRVADNLWEVILSATITAKLGTGVAYLIETQQAGVVKVVDLEADRLAQVLAVDAPQLIFPYLRETIDNVVVKGGFAPVGLMPPDFNVLFEKAGLPGTSSDGGP